MIFYYEYESELYCRACFNYWRFCDCVGDLDVDIGNAKTDDHGNGGIADDDDDSTVGGNVLNVVSPSPPRRPVPPRPPPRTPQPPKKPRPNFTTPDRPPLPRPYGINRPPRTPSNRPSGATGYTPPPKKPNNSTTPDRPPQDPDTQLWDSSEDSTSTPSNTPPVHSPDRDPELPTEITTTPDLGLLTDQELNQLIVDHLKTGEKLDIPPSAVFPRPTLEQLGPNYMPYSRSKTPVGQILQSDPVVPQFFGEHVNADGSGPSDEYKTWYYEEFVPWYDTSALPNQKLLLSGLECYLTMPPPEPGGPYEFSDRTDYVYLHWEARPGDTESTRKYKWKAPDGKIYEKYGRPSPLEAYSPWLFSTLQPRETSLRSLVRSTNYVFPEAWIDTHDDDEYVNMETGFPPEFPYETNPSVTTIDTGTGSPTDIAYGQRLGNSVCWKYSTYQVTNRYASQLQTLSCEREGLIFFTPNQRYFLTALSNPHRTQILIYNHLALAQLNRSIHGIVRIGFESWMPYGIATSPENVLSDQPNWKIKVTASDGTVLPLCSNFPSDITQIAYIAADVNGFSSFNTSVLEFGIYITDLNNDKFGNATPYLIVEYSNYRNDGQGNHTFLSHVDPFRRTTTITPSFEADPAAADTTNYNYLGTTYPISPCDSDKMVKIGEFSDQTGQDISALFSKLWILPSYNSYTLTFSAGGTDIVESCPQPIINTPWLIIPNIGFRIANGKNGKRVVGTWAPPNTGKFIYLVREQHLNIRFY